MTIRVYQFDDVSAPQLTGEAGKLIDILRACLVTGYGTQGAAGWSEEFIGTGVNSAVFRNGTGSSQTYFKILDDGSMDAGARESQMWMFDTMTDINTGTNITPSANTNNFFRKSNTADTVVRQWKIVADEKCCYVMLASEDVDMFWNLHAFGDFKRFNTSYGSAAFILARPGNYTGYVMSPAYGAAASQWQVPGMQVPSGLRSHCLLNSGTGFDKRFSLNSTLAAYESLDGFNTSWPIYKLSGVSSITASQPWVAPQLFRIGSGSGEMNNQVAAMNPMYVLTSDSTAASASFLGVLPGLYDPATSLVSDGSIVTMAGDFSGRQFMRFTLQGNWNFAGFFIEITPTGTW